MGNKLMSRIHSLLLSVGLLMSALVPTAASASPSCLKDHKPYKLSGDTIEWEMTIKPGADCIQGLRWSYMQVFAVWVLNKPANGDLVIVGSGFRYFAKPGFDGPDKFSLVIIGKNRHDDGFSTVDITISHSDDVSPSAASRLDTGAKVASATLSP